MATSREHAPDFFELLKSFKSVTKKPELFLEAQLTKIDELKSLIKKLYDSQNKLPFEKCEDTYLNELITEGFDDEQIWQELELKHNVITSHLIKSITKIVAIKEIALIKSSRVILDSNEAPEEDQDEEEEADDDEEEEDEATINLKRVSFKPKVTVKRFSRENASVVDDKFFKLSQLEEFLIVEDKREFQEKKNKQVEDEEEEDEDDDDDVDLFTNVPSSGDENEDEALIDSDDEENKHSFKRATYEDFFDPPEMLIEKTSTASDGLENDEEELEDENAEGDDDGDDEMDLDTRDISSDEEKTNSEHQTNQKENNWDEDNERAGNADENIPIASGDDERIKIKSNFEKEQERLKRKISELEDDNLSSKPWQLKGEIAGMARPENSLLEEHLLFDHMTRQAPVITEETTKNLEDIILQRIKDKAWDDVERKNKPVEEPFEYRRRIALNQEKSKESLAQVYEKEYLKQQTKDKEEKEIPERSEIKKMMSDLFSKLDALANFHYTPKPFNIEVKAISNIPAITVEEVAPVNISEAALLAPEEIMKKTKMEVKGKTEKSETDLKRERRLKKKFQHRKQNEKNGGEEKIDAKKKKMGEKGAKNDLKSSTTFFASLQDKMATSSQEIVKKKQKKGTKLKL